MGIHPAHDPASHILAGQLLETIAAWEEGQGASLDPTEGNWRIAEDRVPRRGVAYLGHRRFRHRFEPVMRQVQLTA